MGLNLNNCHTFCVALQHAFDISPMKLYYKIKGGCKRLNFSDRSDIYKSRIRSKTFPGIAKAMAEQWAGKADD